MPLSDWNSKMKHHTFHFNKPAPVGPHSKIPQQQDGGHRQQAEKIHSLRRQTKRRRNTTVKPVFQTFVNGRIESTYPSTVSSQQGSTLVLQEFDDEVEIVDHGVSASYQHGYNENAYNYNYYVQDLPAQAKNNLEFLRRPDFVFQHQPIPPTRANTSAIPNAYLNSAEAVDESPLQNTYFWTGNNMPTPMPEQKRPEILQPTHSTATSSSEVQPGMYQLLQVESAGTMTMMHTPKENAKLLDEKHTQTDPFPFVTESISNNTSTESAYFAMSRNTQTSQTVIDQHLLGVLLQQISFYHHNFPTFHPGLNVPLLFNPYRNASPQPLYNPPQLLQHSLPPLQNYAAIQPSIYPSYAGSFAHFTPMLPQQSVERNMQTNQERSEVKLLPTVPIDLDPIPQHSDETNSAMPPPKPTPMLGSPFLSPQVSYFHPEQAKDDFQQVPKVVKLGGGHCTPPNPGPYNFLGSQPQLQNFKSDPTMSSSISSNYRFINNQNVHAAGTSSNQQQIYTGSPKKEIESNLSNNMPSSFSGNAEPTSHHSSPGITIISPAELHAMSDQLVPVNIDFNHRADVNSMILATVNHNSLQIILEGEEEESGHEEENEEKFTVYRVNQPHATLLSNPHSIDELLHHNNFMDYNMEIWQERPMQSDELSSSSSESDDDDSSSGYSADDEYSPNSSNSFINDNNEYSPASTGQINSQVVKPSIQQVQFSISEPINPASNVNHYTNAKIQARTERYYYGRHHKISSNSNPHPHSSSTQQENIVAGTSSTSPPPDSINVVGKQSEIKPWVIGTAASTGHAKDATIEAKKKKAQQLKGAISNTR